MNKRKALEKRLDTLSSELCMLLANGWCWYCGCEGSDPHHKISRNHKRQRWNQENLVWLCRDCHRRAHDEGIGLGGRDLDRRVKIWHESELQELEKELKQKVKELT